MNPLEKYQQQLLRRTFLGDSTRGLGGIALGSLLFPSVSQANSQSRSGGLSGLPHFAPRAKRVVCLFQSGGLSHVDLFDDKPMLHEHAGKEIPPSIKGTQRLTGMTSGQSAYPVVPPLKPGKRCGQNGTWISDLLPNIQGVAGDIKLAGKRILIFVAGSEGIASLHDVADLRAALDLAVVAATRTAECWQQHNGDPDANQNDHNEFDSGEGTTGVHTEPPWDRGGPARERSHRAVNSDERPEQPEPHAP